MEFDPNHHVVTVGSVVQYLNVLGSDSMSRHSMYRGQVNSEWELSCSLERFHKSIKLDSYDFMCWDDLEDHLLDEFMKQSKPYMNFIPENRVEWLVHAQHHGLPTALLDWTTNPLKALFFAVEASHHDEANGSVHFGNGAFYSSELVPADGKLEHGELFCFHPKHLNERIVMQEGCFTLYPLPADFGAFDNLSIENREQYDGFFPIDKKIIIPSNRKPALRRELAVLGITKRTIYPGLDGVTESIKRKMLDDDGLGYTGWR